VLTFAALAPHLAQAPAEHFQATELWTPRDLRRRRSCHCRQCQRPVPSPAWGKPAFCGISLRPHKTAMGQGKSMGGFCRVFPAPSQQDAPARASAMRPVASRGLGVSPSVARVEGPPCRARIRHRTRITDSAWVMIPKMLGFRAERRALGAPAGRSLRTAVAVPAPRPRPGAPRGRADQASLWEAGLKVRLALPCRRGAPCRPCSVGDALSTLPGAPQPAGKLDGIRHCARQPHGCRHGGARDGGPRVLAAQ
jgi:hypothetical protein